MLDSHMTSFRINGNSGQLIFENNIYGPATDAIAFSEASATEYMARGHHFHGLAATWLHSACPARAFAFAIAKPRYARRLIGELAGADAGVVDSAIIRSTPDLDDDVGHAGVKARAARQRKKKAADRKSDCTCSTPPHAAHAAGDAFFFFFLLLGKAARSSAPRRIKRASPGPWDFRDGGLHVVFLAMMSAQEARRHRRRMSC